MAELYIARNGLELAREIAWELELRPEPPTEADILAALFVMNSSLPNSEPKDYKLIKALSLFQIPDHDADIEMLEDYEVEAAKVDAPIVRALPRQYKWFGSVTFTGFGLELFAVEFISPQRHHTETAFVPIDYIDLELAA